jgi:hypothetical protein
MYNNWKKKFVTVGLLVLFSATILITQIFRGEPAVTQLDFIFIFIAYIILFPLIIIQERPQFNRCVYQHHRRAPPLR